jgi:hypothetical protein
MIRALRQREEMRVAAADRTAGAIVRAWDAPEKSSAARA